MTQSILSDFRAISNKVKSFEFYQSEALNRDRCPDLNIAFEAMYQNLKTEVADAQYFGSIDLCLRIKGTGKDSDQEALSILLIINGLFSADEKAFTAEMFEEMVCINGIVVLLHQARSFISATTALAGITPPILMPMVNVYELNRAMQGVDTDMETQTKETKEL